MKNRDVLGERFKNVSVEDILIGFNNSMTRDKPICVIELFSGIGAQEKALSAIGIEHKVIHTCDCDKDAILAYASMRYDIQKEINNFDTSITKEYMLSHLQNKNIGFDFKSNRHTLTNYTSFEKIRNYYIADKLTNNLGDVSLVESIPYCDLLTYSFCCQDISTAGVTDGMKFMCSCGNTFDINFYLGERANICPVCGNNCKINTRSGLLYHVQRLLCKSKLNGTLPKYLLLENVKNLVSNKFKNQFMSYIEWLSDLGYNTYYQVLNSKDFGIPQNRERVFAVSIRKDIDDRKFRFPNSINLEFTLKDYLQTEEEIRDSYWCDLGNSTISSISGNMLKHKNDKMEPFCVASRSRNPDDPSDRTKGMYAEQRLETNSNSQNICNTLTSVQKDNYICYPSKSGNYRFRNMTEVEYYRLMGFTDIDVQRVSKFVSRSHLILQGGNSIVTSCLIAIFYSLFYNDNSCSWPKHFIYYNDSIDRVYDNATIKKCDDLKKRLF